MLNVCICTYKSVKTAQVKNHNSEFKLSKKFWLEMPKLLTSNDVSVGNAAEDISLDLILKSRNTAKYYELMM